MGKKMYCMECKKRLKPATFLQALAGGVDGTEYESGWLCYDCDRKKHKG